MLETEGWDDYALIDSGDGRKLERYGPYTVVRPEPQGMWTPRQPAEAWENADATFTGESDEDGAGRWRFPRTLPDTWRMNCDGVSFLGRFTSFRHVGVFPEQITHWRWMIERITSAGRPLRILNLFAYTGVASLLCARAGAEVTHIDASKKAIAWARENQTLSGLDHLPIRWICEDAMRFTGREIRRGNRYDGIILDPPKFGRGPKNETWDLYRDLPRLLSDCVELLEQKPAFIVLTAYSIRSSFLAIHEALAERLGDRGGLIESGELVLRETGGGRALSTSLFSRWTPDG